MVELDLSQVITLTMGVIAVGVAAWILLRGGS